MHERRTGEPPITEVFMRIQDIDRKFATERFTMDRPEVRNLYLEKGYNVALLLMARQNGHTELRTGIYTYGNEEIHPYSQNRVIVDVPPNIAFDNRYVATGLNLIAPILGGDSRDAAQLIGSPDYFVKDPVSKMISRTYDEIRETQRDHKLATEKGQLEIAEGLDRLRFSLVLKILKERHLTDGISVTKRFGQSEVLATIHFGSGQYVVLSFTPELEDALKMYGGINRDQTKNR